MNVTAAGSVSLQVFCDGKQAKSRRRKRLVKQVVD